MKTTIVGAGPAGLYLGILLKKIDPRNEVTILERNPHDATFGWGVVFSEETLGALRDADPPTHLAITDTFARWDRIDIRYRDRVLRSRGHSFSAIARKRLLAILQDRCLELGVDLRFEVEIDDPAPLARDADLLVGADGIRSVVRGAREHAFGTSLRPQGCKYVWYGTDLVLDAFTFVFKQTEHGLIQVHAYPVDEHTSTWIVEAPEETWRRIGFDAMDETESLEVCRALFEDELQGHRLLSNRSTWLSFMRVANGSWHEGNVVLLGDAAHTAHFSIGSGTKLAMEDSIALAQALMRHEQIETALVDYELERQPVVERFQEAAAESAAYFERVAGHAHMAPLQFAFNLLTRSGRISHANLMLRDAEFVRVLDAWFAGGGTGPSAPPGAVAPPPMFAPFRLGDLDLRNRVVRAPGPASQIVQAARGGAGLIVTELVAVCREGRITPATPTLVDDGDAAAWVAVIDAAHREGAKVALQLGHAGRRGATMPRTEGVDLPLTDPWPLISASAIPYGPHGAVPHAADRADLDRVAAAFAGAAERAAAVGFDVLELNFAHGYLVASFLSPLTNRRSDGYGGSADARLRYPLEVVDAVRGAWGSRPLIVRLSVTDRARRGVGVEEGIEIARRIGDAGAHMIHVAAGQTIVEDRPEFRRGSLTSLSDRVRSEARLPTLVAGYLTTPDEVNTAVGAGRADLCLLDVAPSGLEDDAGSESDPARSSIAAG